MQFFPYGVVRFDKKIVKLIGLNGFVVSSAIENITYARVSFSKTFKIGELYAVSQESQGTVER